MLGAAKHLLFLVENKQKQIPRCARDDIIEASSQQPVWKLVPLCGGNASQTGGSYRTRLAGRMAG
jgi:hypothetical protein